MHRTQIQLTEEQMKMLREISKARNISISEIVRNALDEYLRTRSLLNREEQKKRALSAAGRFRSGIRDVSKKHDLHLAEIYRK